MGVIAQQDSGTSLLTSGLSYNVDFDVVLVGEEGPMGGASIRIQVAPNVVTDEAPFPAVLEDSTPMSFKAVNSSLPEAAIADVDAFVKTVAESMTAALTTLAESIEGVTGLSAQAGDGQFYTIERNYFSPQPVVSSISVT